MATARLASAFRARWARAAARSVPAPEIASSTHSLSGTGDATRARLEVRTEAGALTGPILERVLHEPSGAEATHVVSIDMPDGTSFSGTILLTRGALRVEIANLFRPAFDGQPVQVPGQGGGRAIIILGRGGIQSAYGHPRSLADIRYLATIDTVRRTSRCGNYQNRTTGATRTVTCRYTDATVQLLDRRTGRDGPHTTIRAPSVRCPQTITGRSIRRSYRRADVDRWLERRAR